MKGNKLDKKHLQHIFQVWETEREEYEIVIKEMGRAHVLGKRGLLRQHLGSTWVSGQEFKSETS